MRLARKDAQEVGKRITSARENLKWSQARLGREAGGYTRSSINKLEAGLRPEVSAAQVYGIALALGLTFEELWTGQAPVQTPPSPVARLDAVARELDALREEMRSPVSPSPSVGSTQPQAGKGPRGAKRSRRSPPSSP